MDCEAVLVYVDNMPLVPHSNQAVAVEPFGLTLPLRVAEVEPMFDPALVVTVGSADVVKLTIEPFCVPPLFCPTAR
jgi:hypothetical protein